MPSKTLPNGMVVRWGRMSKVEENELYRKMTPKAVIRRAPVPSTDTKKPLEEEPKE